jgi:RNA polymerase sigma factor (sigma-70 family)
MRLLRQARLTEAERPGTAEQGPRALPPACKPGPVSVIDCAKGMADDDRELLERIHHGDGESFGELYDRTRRWLLTFVIVPRVGRADADDVLAETYHTALRKIGSFQWKGVALLHWLASIARRKAQEHGRQSRARTQPLHELPDLLELPDDVPTAEAEMIRAEHLQGLRLRVAGVLDDLPPRYAEALRLRLIESRARPECAERLGVSTATFDVVLYRATRAFAREWGKHE